MFLLRRPVAILIGLLMMVTSAYAEQQSDPGLDERLQVLKKEVLELNRDLTILEEELLYPSTQVAFFLSLDVGTYIRLVDINLILDGEHIGYHFYTDEEFEALRKGAVQRLYTGNIVSGEHTLKAEITGYGPDGEEYRETAEHQFTKKADRKFVELKIMDSLDESQHRFEFKEWE